MGESLESRIIKHCTGGIKGVELSVRLATEFIKYNYQQIQTVIDRLVDEGEIVEIAYVLPQNGYRISAFYLPKGVRLISNDQAHSSVYKSQPW